MQQHGLSRLVSLRHESPNAFNRLLNPPAGQPQQATFALETRHFPLWLDGQMLQMSQVRVWPRAVKGQSINTARLTLKVTGATVGNWQPDGACSPHCTDQRSGSPS